MTAHADRDATNLRRVVRNYGAARTDRDDAIAGAVQRGHLTRQEIAKITGLSKPRIDQIARGE